MPLHTHPEERVLSLPPNHVFVFGSNIAGRHGKGAALIAKQHFGAVQGISYGLIGRSFAIPTKNAFMKTLSLERVAHFAKMFQLDVSARPETVFYLTRIGCGLAGYTDAQIAPLFAYRLLDNILYPESWVPYLRPTP